MTCTHADNNNNKYVDDDVDVDVDDYDKTRFDYQFKGWSVWLEPEMPIEILNEMKYLKQQCGGDEKGVHDFVPHVTLLYNIPPLLLLPHDKDNQTAPKDLLRKCLQLVNAKHHENNNNDTCLHDTKNNDNDDTASVCSVTTASTDDFGTASDYHNFLVEQDKNNNKNEECIVQHFSQHNNNVSSSSSSTTTTTTTIIQPTCWYYQHYPRSADNGKGFGCSITLWIVNRTPWLHELFHTCRNVFGADERHGDEEKTQFRPHIGLVYAPESKSSFLKSYTNNQKIKQLQHFNGGDTLPSMRAKYLSLWSTKGSTKDWYPIARIEI